MLRWAAREKNRILGTIFASVLGLTLSQGASAEGKDSVVVLSMGTIIQATVYADTQEKATQLTNYLNDAIPRYEALFTVHGEGPMNTLNQKAGQWVALDCKATSLIETSKVVTKASQGAFDPTIGPVVDAWKIGFGGKDAPEKAIIDEALTHVGIDSVLTETQESGQCRAKLNLGQRLDLGAIAKGWIGTQLIEEMKAQGATHAILDLGGNVALLGASPKGQPWRIGIQSPDLERGQTLAILQAQDESVVTSGDYERYILKDGVRYGHILSAKTGYPVPLTMSSVTIVDADGAKADAWCTALFAMGLEKALTYLKQHTELQAFIVGADMKRAWVSASLQPRLTVTDPTITLEVIGSQTLEPPSR